MTYPSSSLFPTEPRLLQRKQHEPRPPGPPWPTGAQNTFSFLRNTLDFLLEMRERYGDVVSVPTLAGPFTLIFHPDGVRHVLQENHRNYNKDVPDYHVLSLVLGKGLLGTDLSAETGRVGRALTTVNHLLAKAFYLPWVLSLPTPQRHRLYAARSALYTVVEQIICERRRHRETHGDLLEMLLEARDEETGEGMTDQQVRDEVLTLLLAGHETTANALSWTFFLLAQHPHVEAKLQEEYQRVLNGCPAMIEDLPQLPFTRMVVEEAMRLYPPAWGLGRRALGNDEICGYCIPKGAYVLVFPYVTHRHPAFWEQPNEFDPERFSAKLSAGRHRFAYFPFGGGPRMCLGNQLAFYEAQLILATILSRYQLRLLPGAVVTPEPLVTLRPRGDLLMTVRRRPEIKRRLSY